MVEDEFSGAARVLGAACKLSRQETTGAHPFASSADSDTVTRFLLVAWRSRAWYRRAVGHCTAQVAEEEGLTNGAGRSIATNNSAYLKLSFEALVARDPG